MNKVTQWILNIVAGIFFYVLFLFFFFPLNNIVTFGLSQVESLSNGAYRISVGSMDPSLIFKSEFRDFRLYKVSEGQQSLIVDLPKVYIGIRYLPLIIGSLEASFEADSKKGSFVGSVKISGDEYSIDAKLTNFGLEHLPVIANFLPMTLKGSLSGDVDIEFFPDKWNQNMGKIDLDLLSIKFLQAKVSPMPGLDLDLPDIVLSGAKGSTGKVQLVLNKGKLMVNKIYLPGPSFHFDMKGRLLVNKRFELSRLALNGKFILDDKLKEAFPFITILDQQKEEDGSYPLSLTGRVSKPRILVGTFDLMSLANM